jgi:PAS domain S-box-containing protein
MNIFSLLSLLAASGSIILGAFVLGKNPGGRLNRVFFLYSLLGAYWALTEFGYRQAEHFSTALFWYRASSLGVFALPLELHFALCFTEKTKLLKKKRTYLLLYGPALAFVVFDGTGSNTGHLVEAYWGWTYTPSEPGTLSGLFDLWFIVTGSSGFFFCAHYYRHRTDPQGKKRAGLVTMGIATPTVLGLMTEPGGVCAWLEIEIPELTSIGFIVECVLLAYAVWKYELFALTPAAAAESILATLTDALFLVGPEGKIMTINPATRDRLGYAESEIVQQPVESFLAPEDRDRFNHLRLEQLLRTGSISDSEITLVARDAQKIPFSLSASIVRDAGGGAQGVVYIGRDLIERKRAEEQIKAALREKEILLEEIHHRVKNNLQIISGLLQLQLRETEEEQALRALRESRNRVHSMAIIHEILYQSEDLARVDFARYIRTLTDHLWRSYGIDSQTVTLKASIAAVPFNVDVAIYCGLIVNELLSNALKHAFPAGRAGEIRLELEPTGNNRVSLTVGDNGVGLPPEVTLNTTQTLGLRLVGLLAQQLEGTLELDRNGGTSFTIVFRPGSFTAPWRSAPPP